MEQAATTITQLGIDALAARWPEVISARVITPIVFWASLEPWAKATAMLDSGCRRRKRRWTGAGAQRNTSSSSAFMSRKATSSRSPASSPWAR